MVSEYFCNTNTYHCVFICCSSPSADAYAADTRGHLQHPKTSIGVCCEAEIFHQYLRDAQQLVLSAHVCDRAAQGNLGKYSPSTSSPVPRHIQGTPRHRVIEKKRTRWCAGDLVGSCILDNLKLNSRGEYVDSCSIVNLFGDVVGFVDVTLLYYDFGSSRSDAEEEHSAIFCCSNTQGSEYAAPNDNVLSDELAKGLTIQSRVVAEMSRKNLDTTTELSEHVPSSGETVLPSIISKLKLPESASAKNLEFLRNSAHPVRLPNIQERHALPINTHHKSVQQTSEMHRYSAVLQCELNTNNQELPTIEGGEYQRGVLKSRYNNMSAEAGYTTKSEFSLRRATDSFPGTHTNSTATENQDGADTSSLYDQSTIDYLKQQDPNTLIGGYLLMKVYTIFSLFQVKLSLY